MKKYAALFIILFLITGCQPGVVSQPSLTHGNTNQTALPEETSTPVVPTITQTTAPSNTDTPEKPADTITNTPAPLQNFNHSTSGAIELDLTDDWQCINYDTDLYEPSVAAMVERMNHPEASSINFKFSETPGDHLYCLLDANYETLRVTRTYTSIYVYSNLFTVSSDEMDGQHTVESQENNGGECEVLGTYAVDGTTVMGLPAEKILCRYPTTEPNHISLFIGIADENRVLRISFRSPDESNLPMFEEILNSATLGKFIPVEAEVTPTTFTAEIPQPNLDTSSWVLKESTLANLNFSISENWQCADRDPDDLTPTMNALADQFDDEFADLLVDPIWQSSYAFYCILNPNAQEYLNDVSTTLAIFTTKQDGYSESSMNSEDNPDMTGCTNITSFVADNLVIDGFPAVAGLCDADEETGIATYRVVTLVDDIFVYVNFRSPYTDILQSEFDAISHTFDLQANK